MAETGRPSDYDPKYCELLIDHMRKGLSFESFSTIADVTKQTLYNWVKAHEEFFDAKSKATELCRLFWEQQGIEGLWSTKGKTFNSAVWIYNMKCRFRDEWSDTPATLKLFAEKVQGLSKEETIKFFEEELKNLKSESE